MSKYEQKAVAAAVGITDMAEANKLLGQSADAYDLMSMKADAGMLSQEEMQEAADRSRDVMEKLENIMQSMAVAVGPLVEVVNWLAEAFLVLDKVLKNKLAPILVVLGVLFTAGTIASKRAAAATLADATTKLLNLQTTLALAAVKAQDIVVTDIGTVATTANTVAEGVNTKATIWGTVQLGLKTIAMGIAKVASWALAGATWALGAAMKFAAGPIGLVVMGLLALGAMIFVSQHSPPLIVGMGVLTTLVIALGVAMYFAAPAFSAAGAGMLAFGGGVALAGLGVLLMGAGFAIMAVSAVVLAVTLPILAAGIFLMGAAGFVGAIGLTAFAFSLELLVISMGALALFAPIILPPMITLGLILGVIAVSMALMFGAMALAGPSMMQISRGMLIMADAISKLPLTSALSFRMIASGLEDIETSNAAPVLREFSDVMTGATNLEETHVTNAKKLVDEIVRYTSVAQNVEAQTATNNLMEQLLSAFSSATGGGAEGNNQDILLVMDPSGTKVLAKAVGVQLDKMHNIYTKRS